ncbi:MAG: HNH endonuclease [Acidimicrobiia bacterium]
MKHIVGRQGRVSSEERLKVWVRSGGRCAFCNIYLLESELTRRPVLLGEVAHNVAASDTGPRGNPRMPVEHRNSAENLLLLCGLHHPDSDKRVHLDLLTVDQLRSLKAEHERSVFEATASVGRRRTVLLRVQGHIRGQRSTSGSTPLRKPCFDPRTVSQNSRCRSTAEAWRSTFVTLLVNSTLTAPTTRQRRPGSTR